MANAPEHVPPDYSTLEAVQHHPELQSQKDVEISNGVHGKERFSTLESAPNSPAPNSAYSPDFNSKGNRYSTLEPMNPDHDHNEKPGAGLGLTLVPEASEPPKKDDWKRRRVCGVPLLFLLIGVVVLLAVIAAVVGGVVGSRKKSNDPKPNQQQNGASTPESAPTGKFIPGPKPSSTGTALQDTWVDGDEKTIYSISSNIYGFLTDNGGGAVGLSKARVGPLDKYEFTITPVPAEAQREYDGSYPWGPGRTSQPTYNIRTKEGRFLGLERYVAEGLDPTGGNLTEIPLTIVSLDGIGWNPSAYAWLFRPTATSGISNGSVIPWTLHSVGFPPNWSLSINNGSSSNPVPQLEFETTREAGENVWRLPKPDENK